MEDNERLKNYLWAVGFHPKHFTKEQLDRILRAIEMAINETEWKVKNRICFPQRYKQ